METLILHQMSDLINQRDAATCGEDEEEDRRRKMASPLASEFIVWRSKHEF